MMSFILIGRSYCRESKPAIISAALSEWDWLVSPSFWYGVVQVYVSLWALSLLQALTVVCLRRGSLLFFLSATVLHEQMKACDKVQKHTTYCTQCDKCLAYMWSCLYKPVKNTETNISPVESHLFLYMPCVSYQSIAALPPSHLAFPFLPYLACFPPSTQCSETPAFRDVSLLAGVILANSYPQQGAH